MEQVNVAVLPSLLSVEWIPIPDTGDIILSRLARLLIQAMESSDKNIPDANVVRKKKKYDVHYISRMQSLRLGTAITGIQVGR